MVSTMLTVLMPNGGTPAALDDLAGKHDVITGANSAQGRFVAVSSIAHTRGRVDLHGLQSERVYNPWAA